jgi:hypothetical protein
MIVSLAFGTFVQQLVAYEVMAARDAKPLGNILRSEKWDGEESVCGYTILLGQGDSN